MPPIADPKKPKEEENTDEDLTPAQIQAINAAVTAQLKRGLKDVVTKSDLEALSTSLVEKVTGALSQQQKSADDDAAKKQGKGGEPAADKATLERIANLEKALKASEQENKTEREARTKAENDRILDAARASQRNLAFTEGVTVNGKTLKAKAEYADVLGDHLAKTMKVGADGKAVCTIRRAPAKGLPEEDVEVSPTEAVTHFFSSKSASAYLPAPQPGVRTPEARKQQTQARRVVEQTTQQAQPEGDDLDNLVGKAAAHLERLGIDPTRLPSS